jgi:hypothetical protein
MLNSKKRQSTPLIEALAGRDSPHYRKHRLHIEFVGVANHPDDYQSRLIRAFPLWQKVPLWALEPHDLALTKLDRSNERDIRDVMFLAQAGLIHRATLVERFDTEMRSYLVGPTPTWHQTTLNM